MKKIMALTLASSLLLAGNTFADEAKMVSNPTVTITAQELPLSTTVDTLTQKYDLIIRNNIIIPDYEYNNKNYFTKKITTKDIVVPDEIKTQAKKIYFLVEEWNPIMYLKTEAVSMDAWGNTSVTNEYNYKVVPFVEGKTEYTFNTADLVKDFSKDEYKNVTISLVAELWDTSRLNLATAGYVTISDKSNILETLKALKEEGKTTYYGYYDTQSLETYLEKLAEKMSRADYKKVLTNAQSKLKSLTTKNDWIKKEILSSITKESDFEANVDKYTLYSETNNLLVTVSAATSSQLQKLRSYDLIDSVFGSK